MEEEEKKNDVFRNRPPNLWNEPSSLTDDHRFKLSAKPLEVYRDDRVSDLYELIRDLAETLSSHKADRWNNLVRSVIEVFNAMQGESS